MDIRIIKESKKQKQKNNKANKAMLFYSICEINVI